MHIELLEWLQKRETKAKLREENKRLRKELNAITQPKALDSRTLELVKIHSQKFVDQFDYTREYEIKAELVHDLLDQVLEYVDFTKEYRHMYGGELGRLYTATFYVADINETKRKEA